MRNELFARGIISSSEFEVEAREKAIRSQVMEGLHRSTFRGTVGYLGNAPFSRVRDHLTDFYFAYNLPYDLFEQIVRETLSERGADFGDLRLSFNPELSSSEHAF